METDVLTLLVKQMEDEKKAIGDAVLAGSAASFEAYREMCGRVHGLSLGQRIVAEMRIRLQKQEKGQ